MSAYWKIPLQVIVLLVGVLVFVFYTFNPGPLIFSAARRSAAARAARRRRRIARSNRSSTRRSPRDGRPALDLARRAQAGDAGTAVGGAVRDARARDGAAGRQGAERRGCCARPRAIRRFTDVNYIIPTFILTQLPIGLIGLLIVGILMAATDTIAAELNSLSTATVIDFYKRWVRPTASDAHYLPVSKIATGLWGLFACGIAVWAAELGSLIEVVNRFGSFFYGSILGVFILAVGFPARHRRTARSSA